MHRAVRVIFLRTLEEHRRRRAGIAVPTSRFVGVIRAVEMTVAYPIGRNAPCAVALKATGAHCINESKQNGDHVFSNNRCNIVYTVK